LFFFRTIVLKRLFFVFSTGRPEKCASITPPSSSPPSSASSSSSTPPHRLWWCSGSKRLSSCYSLNLRSRRRHRRRIRYKNPRVSSISANPILSVSDSCAPRVWSFVKVVSVRRHLESESLRTPPPSRPCDPIGQRPGTRSTCCTR